MQFEASKISMNILLQHVFMFTNIILRQGIPDFLNFKGKIMFVPKKTFKAFIEI